VTAMQAGLLHRLRRIRRQVGDQHRHLNAIRAELARALASGRVTPAMEVLRGYSEAIQAHFVLETQTFFPALHGLRPEFGSDLEALDREHGLLLSRLEQIEVTLSRSALASGAEEVQGFNTALAEHERREEALMARITGDLPGEAPNTDGNPPSR